MKTTITIMTAVLMSTASFAQNNQVQAILKNYLQLKDALVQSDNEQAAKQASALSKEIEQATEIKGKETLLKAAQKISKTPDIEKQRAAFAELSSNLWAIVKDEANTSQDLFYQYCPMKKSYWISSEAAIKNPYYGSKMLTCGNVSEKKTK